MAENGEEALPLTSPTAGSQRFVACPVLIPRYWPLRFFFFRAGLPVWQAVASSVLVGARKLIRLQCRRGWNLVCGDDLKVSPTEWIGPKEAHKTKHGL